MSGSSADMAGKKGHTHLKNYSFFPLQAVPLAAASDGMDEGGHSSCRASQESAGGQWWCQTDGQAAASRAGLWTKTAQVIENTNIYIGPLLIFITQIWSNESLSCTTSELQCSKNKPYQWLQMIRIKDFFLCFLDRIRNGTRCIYFSQHAVRIWFCGLMVLCLNDTNVNSALTSS